MNVFIEEIESNNKGAYLMFIAIKERIDFHFNNSKVVVDDSGFSRVEEAIHNLYRLVHLQRFKIKFHNIVKPEQLSKHNLLTFNNVDLVLNAGGYANGDFWYKVHGKNRFIKKLERYKRFKKNGAPIILLPQAFDTFTSDFMKNYIIELHELADLIYARDLISLNNLERVLGKSEKVKLAPDFTNLMEVENTELVSGDYVTLIPNIKMIHAGIISKIEYIENLILIAKTIHTKGYRLVLLNHEGKDDNELLLEIQNRIDFDNVLLTNLNAIEVKSVIKNSCFLITGRYHGLVSALSQGVPVLATSWSHKYKELLADYNVEDQLLDINNKKEVLDKLEKNLQVTNMHDLKMKLESNSEIEKKKAEAMWIEVFGKVEN